jgi:hypothetical protein
MQAQVSPIAAHLHVCVCVCVCVCVYIGVCLPHFIGSVTPSGKELFKHKDRRILKGHKMSKKKSGKIFLFFIATSVHLKISFFRFQPFNPYLC